MKGFHYRCYQQTKCAKYWPKVKETMDLSNFRIRNCSEKETQEYILRDFQVTYNKEVNMNDFLAELLLV